MGTKENKEWDLVRYAGDEPIKWSFTEIEIGNYIPVYTRHKV